MELDSTNERVRPKIHPMSVFALVCSCIFCCPFAPLAGFILGFISWRAINASQGLLRGRKIALLAMALGLIMLPVQYFVTSQVESNQSALKKEGFQRTFDVLFDTSLPDRQSQLEGVLGAHEGRRPSVEDVERFVAQVEEQYGQFRTVLLINSSPIASGILSQLNQECALYFTFDGGTTTGAARCSIIGTGWSSPYQVRISTLQLNLEEGGLLEFGPPPLPDQPDSEKSEDSNDEAVQSPSLPDEPVSDE
ncbi:MAG: hypothetical protein CBC35_01030 [Planctomycetes bacterium TMED75]|nr:hypothetical protein [Planctomycetaceae bacterium]OUU96387.1 MAG: hypothetical protein CBC35_01030 [Planctomycetes bacterium TMED75]